MWSLQITLRGTIVEDISFQIHLNLPHSVCRVLSATTWSWIVSPRSLVPVVLLKILCLGCLFIRLGLLLFLSLLLLLRLRFLPFDELLLLKRGAWLIRYILACDVCNTCIVPTKKWLRSPWWFENAISTLIRTSPCPGYIAAARPLSALASLWLIICYSNCWLGWF